MFRLEFKQSNADFTDDMYGTTARILREIADKIERGNVDGSIFDINGNNIGEYESD